LFIQSALLYFLRLRVSAVKYQKAGVQVLMPNQRCPRFTVFH
jgi:hypothetical protein